MKASPAAVVPFWQPVLKKLNLLINPYVSLYTSEPTQEVLANVQASDSDEVIV